ncbi:TIGR02302 family protein [Parasulfitobacter algicola]|uniref:TIGR02302 family protein n=1 Tax=Parasulfitobacter algicola TaxID=2614809 RepID=A0ABX2ILU3_9RHOB|nr:TIGR02302 family protein [Sulfitobacter algicola]NSX53849.1 TIGR02302 family protein [Sulfitobacter algicola]
MLDQSLLPKSTRRAATLTRFGIIAERITHSFWPFWTVMFASLACLMMGWHDELPLEVVWGGLVTFVVAAAWTFVRGIRQFSWPTLPEALDRIDATMAGRPISALNDTQAIGAGDMASEQVWQAHLVRMKERASAARPVDPNLEISDRDPFALRYVALIAFVTALLFGSIYRVSSVSGMTPTTEALAAGATWEGWVEPPFYTGKPTLYLNDIPPGGLEVPEGSSITLRFYGEVGALELQQSVANLPALAEDEPPAMAHDFEITQSGILAIAGQNGAEWAVTILPDAAPIVSVTGPVKRQPSGEMQQPFMAEDDYGVMSGTATIALDIANIERRHGLQIDPETREPIVVDLPITISGDRSSFEETLIEDFSQHPFANLPVTLQLNVRDEQGQIGQSEIAEIILPGRRFFDPMASAIIEQRRDLLWTRENAPRVAQVLRAVSYKPDEVFDSETAYLRLRVILRRLETMTEFGLKTEHQEEIAEAMWDLAVLLEEGDLSNAAERLRQAQERLSEAIQNGASDEEIAELMQELRDATRDYMRQLAQQNPQNGDQQSAENQNTVTITEDQLQQMMDQIQELMEQGRMAEAQELLDQLNQMMENMQTAQSQPGQGGPGQEAMEGLADSLRSQQGLSDEAFRDLQEQYNPNAGTGENQQNQGRNGGQGQGQNHEGGSEEGEGQGQSGEQSAEEGLADRQRNLSRELERQRNNLPGAGTAEGDAAREALDRAGRAMSEAEEALRNNDLPGAIDNQAEAMDALREGMRNLGNAMAQNEQQQNNQNGQGARTGEAQPQRRDPLGRSLNESGRTSGTEENMLQGEDVYRRAQNLLDEIRRRSSETGRSEIELEYLRRLLDRF